MKKEILEQLTWKDIKEIADMIDYVPKHTIDPYAAEKYACPLYTEVLEKLMEKAN